ncbi:MAG: sugar ABC transporter ATP-binding protein [Kiritimatiellia bacterium]
MELLRVRDLSKSFGSVPVLRAINLSLECGHALGLVGENGAGKSTLVRCICGELRPDGGSIELAGRACMVPQELTFIPEMSIADNLFLGHEQTQLGVIHRKRQNETAREALARVGAEDLDPALPMEQLGVAACQKVAIAKALMQKAELLVLDEPTAVLNASETECLFAVLRTLMANGIGIVYISHKLEEVLALCSEIAVLRDGVFVSGGPSAEYTPKQLAEKMVGRPLADIYPPKMPIPDDSVAPILEVRHLSDGIHVLDASFRLRPGEILGVAGLAGAGRTELAELICGERPLRGGDILLDGRPVRIRTMREAIEHGIAYLSEDRQGTGLLTAFPIRDNAALSSLQHYRRGPLLSKSKLDAGAEKRIRELHIRCEGGAQPVRSLSGGNQQKVAIAKGLDSRPKIYIFDEPTRGVDVGARREIYMILHELAATGVAILLISSDLGEILGNCPRSLVMRSGTIAGELSGAQLTEKNVMYLMHAVSSQPGR